MDAFAPRTASREELALAVDWAAQEGWNPGRNDAECFRAADPGGFFIGELRGEPIASISVVKYGADFAFLGLYIVRPEFRGHGYGWALWQHAMASAPGRQVGLDGVVAQQANYRKSGFELAWRNVRYEGRGVARPPDDPRIVPLADLPFERVHAYDQPFFPADRAQFLRCWLEQDDAIALGALEGGQVRGYGVMRPCRTGWKIGPLFADDEAMADALFVALAGRAGNDAAIYLDIPEPNAAAMALTRRHGMRMVFETARMYTGTPPATPMARTFGITTFELG